MLCGLNQTSKLKSRDMFGLLRRVRRSITRRTSEASEEVASSSDDADNSKQKGLEAVLKAKQKAHELENNTSSSLSIVQSVPGEDEKNVSAGNTYVTVQKKATSEEEVPQSFAGPSVAPKKRERVVQRSSEKSSGELGDAISFSSQICASWRALESERHEGERIIFDPLARVLAGDDAMKRARASRSPKKSKARFAIRTRFFDDFLEESLACNPDLKQVVILGAGMDTRVYRLRSLRKDMTVFEIDRANVLRLKEKLLETAEEPVQPLCGKVHRLDVDLQEFAWEVGLIVNGFDWNQKSAWLIEGLMYYFDVEDVIKIFKTIRRLSAPGSQLCFSCVGDFSGSTKDNAPNGVVHAKQNSTDRLSKYFRWRCNDPVPFMERLNFKVTSTVKLGGPEASYGLWDSESASRVMYIKFEPAEG